MYQNYLIKIRSSFISPIILCYKSHFYISNVFEVEFLFQVPGIIKWKIRDISRDYYPDGSASRHSRD